MIIQAVLHYFSEHQFLVQIAHVPAKSKLASGPARLHLLDYMFCLTAGVPPKLLGVWPLRELRRFGVVDGKFCFEGGSRCGKGKIGIVNFLLLLYKMSYFGILKFMFLTVHVFKMMVSFCTLTFLMKVILLSSDSAYCYITKLRKNIYRNIPFPTINTSWGI